MTPARRRIALGLVLVLSACGDDDAVLMPLPDSGSDSSVPREDAGTAPRCGASTCGSPLVGEHCCTRDQDITAGVAAVASRCGVDLGTLVPALVGGCVELRQVGELDADCPPRRVGTRLELGCCMPDGACGTLNQSLDLGCQRVLSSGEPRLMCGDSAADAGSVRDGG